MCSTFLSVVFFVVRTRRNHTRRLPHRMSSDDEESDVEGAPCSSVVTIYGEGPPHECGYCNGRRAPGSISFGALSCACSGLDSSVMFCMLALHLSPSHASNQLTRSVCFLTGVSAHFLDVQDYQSARKRSSERVWSPSRSDVVCSSVGQQGSRANVSQRRPA